MSTDRHAPMCRNALGVCLWVALMMGCAARSGEDPPSTAPPPSGQPLVWQVEHWINSEPLVLHDVRGRVVLVRWWTGPDCPYCVSSLPLLQAWYDTYREQGLMVVGFYHHKAPGVADPLEVERLVEQRSITFPVAIDRDWQTLRAWYLDRHDATFTSISVVIGRDGKLRHVQERGDLAEGNEPAEELESAVQRALAEPPDPAAGLSS